MIGKVDGVMIGRASYETPWLLSQLDDINREANPALAIERSIHPTRVSVASAYAKFVTAEINARRTSEVASSYQVLLLR